MYICYMTKSEKPNANVFSTKTLQKLIQNHYYNMAVSF